jgi:uncharacterized protein (DUF433 family)
MIAEIIDRGRGPEIAGTRITVYTILEYADWHHTALAALLDLSSEQVLLARAYIDAHRAEVMAEYEKIMQRIRRGNPPEVQARLEANRPRFLELVRSLRQGNAQEASDAGNHERQ